MSNILENAHYYFLEPKLTTNQQSNTSVHVPCESESEKVSYFNLLMLLSYIIT